MLSHLTTEARNPASAEIDRLSAFEIMQLMNAEDAGVAPAVGREAERIAAATRLIADRLRSGGRLVYLGAGTSGRLGVLDAAECPPTFSTPPEMVVGLIAGGPRALTRAVEGAEDHPSGAETDLDAVQISDKDAVVGIATSGRTPYVVGGLRYARSVGALAIGLSCNRDSELSAVADVTICPVVGPEIVSGSTRLKAGTATKLVLNMLSTGAMILLGKTYGNLMVDLRATNTKLLDRSRRIVGLLAHLPPVDAEALLGRCGGEVKTAIVAHQRNVPPEEARQLLADADGHLSRALGASSSSAPEPQPAGNDSERGATNAVTGGDLVLGIDGGGSKTVAWLARRGETPQVIGRGTAGPSNPRACGLQPAITNLEAAIQAAWNDAHLPSQPVAAACLAMAGTGQLVEHTLMTDWATARNLAAKIEVVPDAEPVLTAGTPDDWGVAVIAGTGSLAIARGRDGQTARSGGWGELFGDEGSGYAVTIAALRAAAKAADGRGPETLLLSRLMTRLRAVSPAELVTAVHLAGRDRRSLASLAIEVITAEEDGDAVAAALLDDAAAELAAMVRAVAERAGLAGRPFPLAVTGGLLLNARTVRERLVEKLRTTGLSPEPFTTVEHPAQGAVLRAQALVS